MVKFDRKSNKVTEADKEKIDNMSDEHFGDVWKKITVRKKSKEYKQWTKYFDNLLKYMNTGLKKRRELFFKQDRDYSSWKKEYKNWLDIKNGLVKKDKKKKTIKKA